MSSNWGIKTNDGYVNFIHGTIDEVWEFETSSSIDDVCVFSEVVAKGYARTLNATAFQINFSEQPQLTIPQSVADYSEKLEQYANPQNKNWKKFLPTEQEEQEHWAWVRKDNNKHIYQIYLAGKALGVDLVKVVEK